EPSQHPTHHRGRHRQLPGEHARLLRPARPAAGQRAADQPARQPRGQPAGAAGRDAAREDQGARAPHHGHGPARQRERGDRRPAAPLDAHTDAGALRPRPAGRHHFGDPAPVPGAAGRHQGLGRDLAVRGGGLRQGRERRRQDLRFLAHAAVLRRQLRLRGGQLAGRHGDGHVGGFDPAARGLGAERDAGLRHAGAGLAGPAAVLGRHGHRLPGAHRRTGSGGAVAAAGRV
ncbi:MAG: Protein of unknown function DUF484, partial [uncultured Ramlibacter sp.]